MHFKARILGYSTWPRVEAPGLWSRAEIVEGFVKLLNLINQNYNWGPGERLFNPQQIQQHTLRLQQWDARSPLPPFEQATLELHIRQYTAGNRRALGAPRMMDIGEPRWQAVEWSKLGSGAAVALVFFSGAGAVTYLMGFWGV